MSASNRSAHQVWYGRREPPLEPRILRAGPLLAELHGPDLRYVRTARNEVVRRVYMAVRDLNWNTLPVVVGEPAVEEADGAFRVSFDARNTEGDVDFSWSATIEGTADGTVSYEMDGTAHSAFAFAKLGLCLHHPVRESAGRLFRGVAPGTPVGGELPRLIGPQIRLPDEGWDLPLFDPVQWLEIDLPQGERIRFDFEGDLFEMEDQRNWTDGSFKTACTPAFLRYNHTIQPGGRIRQKLTFRVAGATRVPRRAEPLVLRVGGPIGSVVPPVGLGSASHREPPTDRHTALLRALGPAHLRVDVRPSDTGAFEYGLGEARALGAALELALFINGDDSFVSDVIEVLLRSNVRTDRVLVFDDDAEVTPLDQVEIVRSRLTGIPVGGGTNIYFNELNRHRPDPERLDVVAYSINPQIHAFDELSLVESLAAQYETVRSARAFSEQTPIAVTPITLRPRFNAVATVEESSTASGLPRQVDPRQMSLFGAAWTLGSVKNLAEAGAASLTYFETTGWRGVVEHQAGSATDAFPSLPGEPFPIYHVLADVCAWRGAAILDCQASDQLAVVGFAVRAAGRLKLLVANLEAAPKSVRIEGVAGPARLQRLSDETAPGRSTHMQVDEVSALELAPFEIIRIDA